LGARRTIEGVSTEKSSFLDPKKQSQNAVAFQSRISLGLSEKKVGKYVVGGRGTSFWTSFTSGR